MDNRETVFTVCVFSGRWLLLRPTTNSGVTFDVKIETGSGGRGESPKRERLWLGRRWAKEFVF